MAGAWSSASLSPRPGTPTGTPTRRPGDDEHVMTGTSVTGTGLSWNIVADLRQLLQFPFMVNALLAGTVVAVAAGALGWFMVLRRQSFAGHTLAVVSFPGAAGAILAGISAIAGYFTAAVGAALVIAAVPRPSGGRAITSESPIVATAQAFSLALLVPSLTPLV